MLIGLASIWPETESGSPEIENGSLEIAEGDLQPADLRFRLSAHDFFDVLAGRANPDMLFMEERLQIEGEFSLALRFRRLFGARG